MIFRKSSGDFQSQHINMDILIQLHFRNQNMVHSLIVKSAKSTKEMLLWIEKLIPHIILKPPLLRSGQDMSKTARILHEAISGALPPGRVPANRVSVVSFTSSVFSRFGNIMLNLNKLLHPFFSAPVTALYWEAFYKIPSQRKTDIRRLSNVNYMKFLNTETQRVRNSAEPAFEHKSYLNLSQDITSLNHMMLFDTSFYPKTIYNVSLTGREVNKQFISHGNDLKILNPEIQTIRNNPKSETAMSYSYVTSSNARSLLNDTSLKNAVLYPPVPYRASLPGGAMGRQLNYGGHMQIISPETLIIKNSSGLLIKGTCSLKETYQNPATFVKPILRHEHHKYGSEAFFTMQGSDALKNKDNFYFHNNRNIEQAVEEVKKIAQEAKETATKGQGKPSVEMDIRHQVDLNKLSDQVYQNIERRLRIEKERRGL